VFSTNLCFFRSPPSDLLRWYGIEKFDCWDYHEQFLKIVNPKVIVCNGNGENFSAYVALKRISKPNNGQNTLPWYRGFSLKWFFIDNSFWGQNRVLVLGIPHMSRYTPDNIRVMRNGDNELFEKIRGQITKLK
jgi:hypothetical protein